MTAAACATCWGPLSSWALLAFLVVAAGLVWACVAAIRQDRAARATCWSCHAGRHVACESLDCRCCGGGRL